MQPEACRQWRERAAVGSRGYECPGDGAPEQAHLAGGLGCTEAVSERVGMGSEDLALEVCGGPATSQQGCSTENSLVYT